MTNTSEHAVRKVARLNVAAAALEQWQRGAITWAEAIRRMDLSTDEETRLGSPSRYLGEKEMVSHLARHVFGL
jgi:hypothetical protein